MVIPNTSVPTTDPTYSPDFTTVSAGVTPGTNYSHAAWSASDQAAFAEQAWSRGINGWQSGPQAPTDKQGGDADARTICIDMLSPNNLNKFIDFAMARADTPNADPQWGGLADDMRTTAEENWLG